LLERGGVFDGSITIGLRGAPGLPVVISAYGRGDNPVINGFFMLSHWSPDGNGIWKAACSSCGVRMNMVTLHDSVQPMGRYPNADDADKGYLKIQSHNKTSSFTDSSLSRIPDWTGGEVVIRKNRYIIDHSRITSQNGNMISYASATFYEPTDKFGYFIQDHIKTLDEKGEWYYNPASKTVSLYFGKDDPGSEIIGGSTVDTLLTMRDSRFIVLDHLSFRGANFNAISLINSDHITISNCSISFSGSNAIKGALSNYINIQYDYIFAANNDGIDLTGDHNTVSNNKIRNTGTVAGMGAGENSYIGITSKGNGNSIEYNEIDHTGYIPIYFLGDSELIKNNFIDYFAFVKDDGGGIYTWSGKSDSVSEHSSRKIIGNIVLNGITAVAGTNGAAGIADGIYLDDNTDKVDIIGNTVSKCEAGIYMHNAHEITVRDNTLFDNNIQLYLKRDLPKFPIRNNKIYNNRFAAKTDRQTALLFNSFGDDTDLDRFADLDSNTYYFPGAKNGVPFHTRSRTSGTQTATDFLHWRSGRRKDANSRGLSFPAGENSIRFEYNATKRPVVLPLDADYTDPLGQVHSGNITLAPFTSVILIKK
jgi:parallel beta-helix repeat protein